MLAFFIHYYPYDGEEGSCKLDKMRKYLVHIWNFFAWEGVLSECIKRINESLGKSMDDRHG